MNQQQCRLCHEVIFEGGRKHYHEACRVEAQKRAQAERRQCKRCRKVKAPSSFSNDRSRADGKFPWCKTCQTQYSTGNRFQDPDAPLNGLTCPLCDTPIRGRANRKFCSNACRNRCQDLSKKYGLAVADYRRLVEDAAGKCPICQKNTYQWHVDHNHRTGLTTGCVCSGCNVGALAMTFHDVAFVERLLAYLKETPAERLGIEAKSPEGATQPSNLHKVWGRSRYGK